jgi:hypothetical protein
VGVGGNPDDFYRAIDRPDVGFFVAGYHLNSQFVYDPSVEGAIESVAWSIDFKNLAQGHHTALAIEQNGVQYLALPSAILTAGAGLGVWVNHSLGGFTEGNFGGPDFSQSGAPITFGFRTANSYNPVAGDVDNVVGYDNLEITVISAEIQEVPALATGALVALTLMLASVALRLMR